MITFLLRILSPIFDNRFGQILLQKVHLMILYLQNYGRNGDFRESGELQTLKRLAAFFNNSKNLTIFDVGANVGDYSKEIDKSFNEKAKIYCFEPSKKTFEILINNIKDTESFILVNKGLGIKDEELVLYSNTHTNTQSSVLKRDMSHWNEEYNLTNEEKIQITTLDGYCSQNNINTIDFLKIDVEGNEMNLFHGAKKMIQNNQIKFIQFEFGVASVDGKYFFKDVFYFLNKNYKIYRITRNNLFEITKYNEQLEVFLTTNYLAVCRSEKKFKV